MLECDITARSVKLLYKSNVNNKTAKGKAKTHAEKLSEIAAEIKHILLLFPYAYPVQEDALGMMTVIGGKNLYSAKTVQSLAKVVGLSEFIVYEMNHGEFDKIPPKQVKKLVAGSSTAEKEEVAAAVIPFVGEQDFECDDESDAVAVGLAWLISNNYLDDPFAENTSPAT